MKKNKITDYAEHLALYIKCEDKLLFDKLQIKGKNLLPNEIKRLQILIIKFNNELKKEILKCSK